MKGKILVACGDDECRNELLNSFRGSGLRFHSIWEDADLILEVLESDYDLIIYDLEISNLDGLKMVKILRKIRPKVSLIVFSKDPSTELGGKILQEGVSYYAVKPIDTNVIKKAIFAALNQSEM